MTPLDHASANQVARRGRFYEDDEAVRGSRQPRTASGERLDAKLQLGSDVGAHCPTRTTFERVPTLNSTSPGSMRESSAPPTVSPSFAASATTPPTSTVA